MVEAEFPLNYFEDLTRADMLVRVQSECGKCCLSMREKINASFPDWVPERGSFMDADVYFSDDKDVSDEELLLRLQDSHLLHLLHTWNALTGILAKLKDILNDVRTKLRACTVVENKNGVSGLRRAVEKYTYAMNAWMQNADSKRDPELWQSVEVQEEVLVAAVEKCARMDGHAPAEFSSYHPVDSAERLIDKRRKVAEPAGGSALHQQGAVQLLHSSIADFMDNSTIADANDASNLQDHVFSLAVVRKVKSYYRMFHRLNDRVNHEEGNNLMSKYSSFTPETLQTIQAYFVSNCPDNHALYLESLGAAHMLERPLMEELARVIRKDQPKNPQIFGKNSYSREQFLKILCQMVKRKEMNDLLRCVQQWLDQNPES